MCERLEDFLVLEDPPQGDAQGDAADDASAFGDCVREALEDQAAALSRTFEKQVEKLNASWETRLQHLQESMDAERTENIRKLSRLAEAVGKSLPRPGIAG